MIVHYSSRAGQDNRKPITYHSDKNCYYLSSQNRKKNNPIETCNIDELPKYSKPNKPCQGCYTKAESIVKKDEPVVEKTTRFTGPGGVEYISLKEAEMLFKKKNNTTGEKLKVYKIIQEEHSNGLFRTTLVFEGFCPDFKPGQYVVIALPE